VLSDTALLDAEADDNGRVWRFSWEPTGCDRLLEPQFPPWAGGLPTGYDAHVPNETALNGTVALVTGGTKGIGRSIAGRLADQGATVVICARNPPAEPVTGTTDGAGPITFMPLDLKETDSLGDALATIVAEHGSLDLLVNNAGGAPPTDGATTPPKLHEAIVRLNLLAPLHLSQAANQVMQEQEAGGHIINIGSVTGMRAAPGSAAYGAAKAGLISLTKSLAVEWGPKVRVNSVVAGAVVTEDALPFYGGAEGVAAIAADVPLERLAQPSDVANAVVLLASPLAFYANGTNLVLDGGGESPAFTAKQK